MIDSIRARSVRLLASLAIAAAVLSLAPILGTWRATSAQAQYLVDAEFRTALSPYGRWQNHSRWGEVWLPDPVPADWRPYARGRWIYTDDWGWYWEAADEEAAWGWVAYHYGRWVNDPELGWLWIPGEDWGPAWVDWRYGDEYVGWAPLPPDELLVVYRDDPIYWSFVRPHYLLAPRVFTVFVPARERVVIIRRTKIVNRTVIIDRDRDRNRNGDRDRGRDRARVAVNAGIDPRIIARATGKPIRAAKVEPVVLKGSKVDGAREVDANEGRHARAVVKQGGTVIKPTERVQPPKELGANDKGPVGDGPPKAAQSPNGSNTERASGDDRSRNNRAGDQGRSPPPAINVIRGGSQEIGRPASPPGQNGRSGQQQLERRAIERDRIIHSPPPPAMVQRPPPPVVRRPPPPPPQAVMRAPPPPPPAANQRQSQDQRANRANRQLDDRIR
jgi:hypothetical protein